MRFLGPRVYLAVVLTLVSSTGRATTQHLSQQLRVSVRTLNRWRAWWRRDFLRTPFWQSMRTRFKALAPSEGLPQSLLDDRAMVFSGGNCFAERDGVEAEIFWPNAVLRSA